MVLGDRYLSIRGMATVVFGVFRYKVIVTLTQFAFMCFYCVILDKMLHNIKSDVF